MSWEAIGAIAGVIGVVNALLILPAFGFLKWLLDHNLQSRDEALEARFETLTEKIKGAQQMDHRLSTLYEKHHELKEAIASDYIHRRDWVRVEGGRDVSMRHLREDISSLKTSIAQIKERLYKPEHDND